PVTSEGFLNGTNLILNDDQLGANQGHPQIAIRADGGFAVVWEDFRRGGSDIFMRRFDQSASPLSDDYIVNEGLGRFYHGRPDLACDELGNLLVVWEDTRGGLLEIYAQLFDNSGNPTGGNLRVNCQGMISNFSPSCDMSPGGDFVAVWSATEGSQSDVYGRLFSSSGEPVDACFRINDDGLSVDHLQPRVAMDGSGGFVVVWQDGREEQDRIYAQRFAPDGSRKGANFAVYCDRSNPAQYDADVDLNQRGDFVVTWVEPFLSPATIFAQRYDSSGAPVDTNLAVVDDPLASPEDPKVAMTDDGHFMVAWTDGRASASDIYFQTFSNGWRQGSNRRVNDESEALQDLVDITTGSSFLYSVWRDNRVPGLGFSIFFNTVDFTETAVEDDRDQETDLPRDFHLAQNYPNPFNPATRIQYTVGSKNTQAVPVTLRIYNVLGQLVRTLVDEKKAVGNYRVNWDGRDDSGRALSSGVYLYTLRMEDLRITKRMLLLR
ncbi:MAG: T9SS type A sorting domain-containing protein, partial [Candidatus Zixiibacteriota bacterium]